MKPIVNLSSRIERIEHERFCDIYDLAQVCDQKKCEDLQAKIDRATRDIEILKNGPFGDRLKIKPETDCRDIFQLESIFVQSGISPLEFRNGYLDTEILEAVADRLDEFQKGPLACEESEKAAKKIRDAVDLLRIRVVRRKASGTHATQTEDSETPKPKVRAIFYQGNSS